MFIVKEGVIILWLYFFIGIKFFECSFCNNKFFSNVSL